MSRKTASKELKVVLLGSSGCGKSGLIIRSITNKFLEDHDPDMDSESYRKVLSVDGSEVTLDILDTAGSEQFATMQQYWLREGEIFLIVYDITSRESFNKIEHFVHKIADAKKINLSESETLKRFLIVANKCDLEEQRKITEETGKAFADKYNVPFFECSSKTQKNLNELWIESVRLSRRIDKKHALSPKTSNVDSDIKEYKQSSNICCCVPADNNDDKDSLHERKRSRKWNATDDIRFFSVKEPPADIIGPPVLALKNFRIQRHFALKRFLISMVCGLILPIVILLQTIAFLMYDENKKPWFYPNMYDYDKVHHWILLDYLGLIVGRKQGQDPETVRDRKWFLRQSTMQKVVRVILCILLAFAFTILYYNVSQVENQSVSRVETVGPFFLFWSLWFLLSAWIAFEPTIYPEQPPNVMSRLRAITLLFGEYFTHRTSAYKFLRAYESARQEHDLLSFAQYLAIFCISAIFAVTPGLTRLTVGDDSDGIEQKVFWTEEEWMIQAGAALVNFCLVAIFIFGVEIQYTKHFGSYREWMRDLTMLLSKEHVNNEAAQAKRRRTNTAKDIQELIEMDKSQHISTSNLGKEFSNFLFLSLSRRSNALGWLEIRSFLAIEGKLLFGEQELPTLFLMFATVTSALWILYRVYFGVNAWQSILFNGTVVLMFICLISLIRIAITGYAFQTLQASQERLLGEQKLWIRCTVAQNIGAETIDVKEANFGLNGVVVEESHSEQPHMEENMLRRYTEQKEVENGGGDTNGNTNEIKSDDEIDDGANNEAKPLLGAPKLHALAVEKSVLERKRDVLQRLDTTNWHQYTFEFLDDMLFIVKQKDIYPKLFKVKLNSVLTKAIGGVFISVLVTSFKVFWE